MSVALAATFHPRGEMSRLKRLLPHLQSVYSAIVVSWPPTAAPDEIEAIKSLPGVRVSVNAEWSHGRYTALQTALETSASHIHYADMDRLLRWIETRPDEWRRTVDAVQQCDCLVIGRTEQAWETHPRALRETERVYTTLFAHLLGRELDLSAGSKGFSRRAVEFLMANSSPGRALGADAEWIMLLHRAGFQIETLPVDGLDWESADRYQEQAADSQTQRRAAEAYDADPEHWSARVKVAEEVVEAGLDALKKPLIRGEGRLRYLEVRRHTMRARPGPHLTQAGVELARRVGSAIGPFNRVITSTISRAYETAVAMGFAVDEQCEQLSVIVEGVEDEVAWDAGFAAFADAVRNGGATARFAHTQAEFWRTVVEALPEGGSALLISHGGIIEAGAVACLPDADHAAWGPFCDYCEGVRLSFDGKRFVDAEILRVKL